MDGTKGGYDAGEYFCGVVLFSRDGGSSLMAFWKEKVHDKGRKGPETVGKCAEMKEGCFVICHAL